MGCYAIGIIWRRSEGDWEIAEDGVKKGLQFVNDFLEIMVDLWTDFGMG